MLCTRCHQYPATVHMASSINGYATEMHLCSQCAAKWQQEQGEAVSTSFPLDNILSSFFSMRPSNAHEQEIRCDQCGLSYEQFRKTGLLGCAHCYNSFRDALSQLFGNIQAGNRHIESRTSATQKPTSGNAQQKMEDIDALRTALEKCVKAEEYEKAAKLRDRIRVLEQGEA